MPRAGQKSGKQMISEVDAILERSLSVCKIEERVPTSSASQENLTESGGRKANKRKAKKQKNRKNDIYFMERKVDLRKDSNSFMDLATAI